MLVELKIFNFQYSIINANEWDDFTLYFNLKKLR